MSKQVQRRRGTATQHTSFTGAEGEVSVNTTNKSTHVHDGVTAGGIETARADLDNVSSADVLAAAGVTASAAELNRVDGVTSPIQTQIDAKAPKDGAVFTGGVDVTGTLTSDGIGIGTDSPTQELEVHSTGDATVLVKTSGTGDADATLQLDSAASGESMVEFMHDGVSGAGIQWFTDGGPDLNIFTAAASGGQIDFQPNESLAMRITADGDVGIGTGSPTTALDVAGTITSDGLTVEDATEALITISDTSHSNQRMKLTHSSGSGAIEVGNNGAYGNFNLKAWNGTSSVTRMKVNSGGSISFYEDTGTTAKLNWDASDESLEFGDSVKAIFGNSNDLQIYHDGSNSYIKDAGAGNLSVLANVFRVYNAAGNELSANFVQNGAVTLYHDGAQKLSTSSTGVTVTGNARFLDNDKVTFGDGNDLQIYHNETNSIVSDAGEGSLSLQSNGSEVNIWDAANGQHMAQFQTGGKVVLRHNGVTKFETTSTGVDVTGTLTSDKIGIGTVSPTEQLEVHSTGDTAILVKTTGTGDADATLKLDSAASGESVVEFLHDGVSGAGIQWFTDGGPDLNIFTSAGTNGVIDFQPNNSLAMRLDASGNLLLGTTTVGYTNEAIVLRERGEAYITSEGRAPLLVNRLTSDGVLVSLRKDSTTVGRIGAKSGDVYIGTGDTALAFYDAGSYILPFNASTSGYNDNSISLGNANYRFDDIYATNGTIQTSDRNEKQDIEALSDAETRVAQACKGLLRKFRWVDAVAEKGDDARIHFGIIAQDLQDAFTAEGLDAGRYAMFISSTWWDTQTEVPAVEAVAEVLDDEGNVVTEAVEAKEAYTRTDTYETQEDAPEGATERTRLGVRYPELLAFIIAAI